MFSMRKALRGAATSAALRAHDVLPDAARRLSWGPLFVLGLATGPRAAKVSGLDPANGHVEAVKWAEKMADLAADVLAKRVERAVLEAGEKLCSEEVT